MDFEAIDRAVTTYLNGLSGHVPALDSIMVIVTGSVLFLGETLSGTPVTLQFSPGNSTINWLGKTPWPNGAISWLRFDTAAEKHYFSSETGPLVFGSHKSTRALYDEANRYFGGPTAQNL